MEAIAIPSPTVFLRSPALRASPPPISPRTASNAKRKSTVSKAKVASTVSAGAVKPKQSKSRNGCVTCKAKRLKCDETKPTCEQCQKRNVECGGYKKDFKWRSFVEATFTSKSPVAHKTAKPSSPVKSEVDGDDSPSPSSVSAINAACYQPSNSTQYVQQSPHQPTLSSFSITNNGFDSNRLQFMPEHRLVDSITQVHPYQDTLAPLLDTGPFHSRQDDRWSSNSTASPSTYTSGQSPRLIDLLLPDTDLTTPPDYTTRRTPTVEAPYQNDQYTVVKEEEIELYDNAEVEVQAQDTGTELWCLRSSSPLCISSSSSSSSGGSRFPSSYFIFNQPKLSPNSPEMLMLGFDKHTCGILSVKDGPTENPWRTLVWPLARESPALYHAISSMTAFHSSKLRPRMKLAGMEHMRRSIQHLQKGMENMRLETALATTLVLAFAESWDVHVSTGIKHLRGAKALMTRALTRQNQSSMNEEDFDRLKFLCNTWVYMDVIARLTNVDDDTSNDAGTALWPSFHQPGAATEVDPLMGCAATLFPLIGRVANLVRKIRKTSSNSINIISQANDLKALVEAWQPPDFIEPPEDPTSNIQHSLQTAEAYRWATLLYLHQAVPEVPSETAAQLAKRVLVYLATVPLSSRAIIVHIYPLLAAGCEAANIEDRSWVEDRWTNMSRRMLIGNIDRCLEVVKEVWARRDAYELAKTQKPPRRLTFSMTPAFTSPTANLKRAFDSELQSEAGLLADWSGSDPFSVGKRRALVDDAGLPAPLRIQRSSVAAPDGQENVDFEMTVRGRLHWVGVMKDWDWEVLLG